TMAANILRVIATKCSALTTLRLEQRSGVLKKVKPKKIVKETWTCTNLTCLELAVAAKCFDSGTYFQDQD
ncbi:hypothetical protein BGW39_003379, partial [Mortierella sp. 14UC]